MSDTSDRLTWAQYAERLRAVGWCVVSGEVLGNGLHAPHGGLVLDHDLVRLGPDGREVAPSEEPDGRWFEGYTLRACLTGTGTNGAEPVAGSLRGEVGAVLAQVLAEEPSADGTLWAYADLLGAYYAGRECFLGLRPAVLGRAVDHARVFVPGEVGEVAYCWPAATRIMLKGGLFRDPPAL